MRTTSNSLVTLYQTQLEASRRLADAMFSGTERLDHVLIEATHRAITDQLNLAQAVASVRDPNGVADLHATYLSHRPDNAVNYQREIASIVADIQSEIGKSMQYYMEQFGSTMSSGTADAARAAWTQPQAQSQSQSQAQAQSQSQANAAAFNPVTGMFSVWETALREVATLASRNMAVARNSLEKVASATAEAAQRSNGATAHEGTSTAGASGSRAAGRHANGRDKSRSAGRRSAHH